MRRVNPADRFSLQETASHQIVQQLSGRADQRHVVGLLGVQAIDDELRLLAVFVVRLGDDDLTPVGPRAIHLPLRLEEDGQTALGLGKLRNGFVRLLVVRNRLVVSPRLDMSRGARIERPHQRAFRIRQRRQAFQHGQSRLDFVIVRRRRDQPAVFGQEADRLVEATLRAGARREVEEHRRVLEQRALHPLQLLAQPHGRRGRHVRIVIVGHVLVAVRQDRVVEPRDLLPEGWRRDALTIAGDQCRVQLRQLTPRFLVSQRPDTEIEQGQRLVAVTLLISRQRQVAADREVAGVQGAGSVEELCRLLEILGSVRLCGVGHQGLDLDVRRLGDPLEPFLGVLGEQHVLGGQVLFSGVEQAALLLRRAAQVCEPLCLRFFYLPLLFVSRKA
jgi:hypothetical protein